jgi:endonuclease IV
MNEAEWDHIECRQSLLWLNSQKLSYETKKASAESEFNYVMMSAMFFMNLISKKEEKQKKIEVFLISMTDIEKS